MNTRILHLWDKLRSSYWFVPMLMLVGAAGLAAAALYLDREVLRDEAPSDWLYGGGVEGARTLLSTVAGSVVTVAGVVFSITIAALTQASTQFGPRLLRNFMRDTGNQVVLGTFVGTFLYCVLILRTVPEGEAAAVPNLSVTGAVVLSVASLCVLVYFIHHISVAMQAPHVVARAAAELTDSLARRYPSRLGSDAAGELGPVRRGAAFGPGAGVVKADTTGYLQAIDEEELLRLATEGDLRLEVLRRPGTFVSARSAVVLVWPARAVDARLCSALRATFLVGGQRTTEQDIEFALDQMVEIAVRALSPGVNDPFTAMTCIDWLGDALRQLAERPDCSAWRSDAAGTIRVATRVSTFAGLVDAAFNQVRQYGRHSVPVTIRLLETLAALAEHVREPEQRAVLARQAHIIHRDSCALVAPEDRADVDGRYRAALEALVTG